MSFRTRSIEARITQGTIAALEDITITGITSTIAGITSTIAGITIL